MALLAGCGGPQLTLILEKDPDLAAGPPFVKFQIRALSEPLPSEFGPFDVRVIPDEQFAEVPPGEAFYIDVIGCKTGNPDECVQPDTFVARGCTSFLTLQRDEIIGVTVVIHNATAGAELCPPAPPP